MNRGAHRRLRRIEQVLLGRRDMPTVRASCVPDRPDGSRPTDEEEAAALLECFSMTPEEWEAKYCGPDAD